MPEQLPFTALLNRLFAVPVTNLLQALHIHPEYPQAPITNPVAMQTLASRPDNDQPFTHAITRSGRDRVYIGNNDFQASPRTATVDVSANARATHPTFRSIRIETQQGLEALDLAAIGPGIENHELFPNRTNVSWYTELVPGRVRARIFERGVGETAASGTGATGVAVAHVLRGGDSPVTVVLDGGELDVEVGEDLHINLTGWAVPVFRGTLADDFVKELHAIE